jgi:hypothetical protein
MFSFIKWEPLTIQDILILIAILVALFGERLWKTVDKKNKRKKIKQILLIPLKRLKHDIERIRDERNPTNSNRSEKTKIRFNQTSFDEVKNHSYLLTDIIISNVDYLDLPKDSKTIEFFTHYNKNIETLKSRIEKSGEGYLTLGTVNILLETLDLSIQELS